MENEIDKNLNYSKVSLEYLKKYNEEIIIKLRELEDKQHNLQNELDDNNIKIQNLILQKKNILYEIQKGKELEKMISKNNRILNKIHDV